MDWLKVRPHFIPGIISSIMLIIAIAPMPYDYYSLLRWFILISALFVQGIGITLFRQRKRILWVVFVFGFIAILFNPFNPADLSKLGSVDSARDIWIILDLICAVVFTYTAIAIKKSQEETWDILLYLGLILGATFFTTIAFAVLLLLREFLMVFR